MSKLSFAFKAILMILAVILAAGAITLIVISLIPDDRLWCQEHTVHYDPDRARPHFDSEDGAIGGNIDAPYRSGPSRTWIKVKSSQNFYGWREPPPKFLQNPFRY